MNANDGERKACNFLIPEAEGNLALYSAVVEALGSEPHEEVLAAVLEGFRTFYGGLWVGGTVQLSSMQLAFTPNLVNRLAHKGDYSLSIPLADITDLSYEFGLVSGIIRVATQNGSAKLRCFSAKSFLNSISERCVLARRK